jgi:hypothetical protein
MDLPVYDDTPMIFLESHVTSILFSDVLYGITALFAVILPSHPRHVASDSMP